MTRCYLDTDVILDALLLRPRHADAALEIFNRVHRGELVATIGASTVDTIFYLLSRSLSASDARAEVGALLGVVQVQPVNRRLLTLALHRQGRDFEDDLQMEAALAAGCEVLFTRNLRDFEKSSVRMFSKPILPIARAVAPILPAWVVPTKTIRILSSIISFHL